MQNDTLTNKLVRICFLEIVTILIVSANSVAVQI